MFHLVFGYVLFVVVCVFIIKKTYFVYVILFKCLWSKITRSVGEQVKIEMKYPKVNEQPFWVPFDVHFLKFLTKLVFAHMLVGLNKEIKKRKEFGP